MLGKKTGVWSRNLDRTEREVLGRWRKVLSESNPWLMVDLSLFRRALHAPTGLHGAVVCADGHTFENPSISSKLLYIVKRLLRSNVPQILLLSVSRLCVSPVKPECASSVTVKLWAQIRLLSVCWSPPFPQVSPRWRVSLSKGALTRLRRSFSYWEMAVGNCHPVFLRITFRQVVHGTDVLK